MLKLIPSFPRIVLQPKSDRPRREERMNDNRLGEGGWSGQSLGPVQPDEQWRSDQKRSDAGGNVVSELSSGESTPCGGRFEGGLSV